jgi:hypothetical protein
VVLLLDPVGNFRTKKVQPILEARSSQRLPQREGLRPELPSAEGRENICVMSIIGHSKNAKYLAIPNNAITRIKYRDCLNPIKKISLYLEGSSANQISIVWYQTTLIYK